MNNDKYINFQNDMYFDPNAYGPNAKIIDDKYDDGQKYNYAQLPKNEKNDNSQFQSGNFLYPNTYNELPKSYNVAEPLPKPQQPNAGISNGGLLSNIGNLLGGGGIGNLLGGGGIGNLLGMLGGQGGGGLTNMLSGLMGNNQSSSGGGLDNIMKMMGNMDLKKILGGDGGGLSNILGMFNKNTKKTEREEPSMSIDDYEKVEK